MARYLVISSQVAHGYVGLSAIVPALQALGHEVIALPTILLSNHPGHDKVAGMRIDPAVLGQMIDALWSNGRLAALDGVLTGYLPTVEHVAVAAAAVRRVGADYLCDPVIGDDPKGLYVPLEVATAIRSQLLPLAHALSPNRFELEWLSGTPIKDARDAAAGAQRLGGRQRVVATSIPGVANVLRTLAIEAGEQSPVRGTACTVARRASVPHGTGDLLSALLLAGLALGRAVGCIDAAIAASAGADELRLIPTTVWLDAAPVAETAIEDDI